MFTGRSLSVVLQSNSEVSLWFGGRAKEFEKRTYLVSDDNPRNSLLSVVRSNGGNSSPLSSKLVQNGVGFVVGGVDGSNKTCENGIGKVSQRSTTGKPRTRTVLRDVLEMSTVLEPRSSSGNLIRRKEKTNKSKKRCDSRRRAGRGSSL